MWFCNKRALYKADESLNLDYVDGIESGVLFNKHSILEDSMKLYRQLKKTKKRHR